MKFIPSLFAVLTLAGCCNTLPPPQVPPAMAAPMAMSTPTAQPAPAAQPKADESSPLSVSINPTVTVLDNGITVAVVEDHQSPVVAVRVYVRTGSIYEGKYVGAGVSHFLEHLLCGGATPKRTEDESRKLLDSIGAQSNAYTSHDHTCFYIDTASRFADTAIDLLSDWMMNNTIPEKSWERERGVIQREMESRESDPDSVAYQNMDEILFQVLPARFRVIGYPEPFRAITRDDIYAYYKNMYRPDNMIVVVAGDIKTDFAIAKVRGTFGAMPRSAAAPEVLPVEPAQLAPRRIEKEMPSTQAHLMMAWRTVPLSSPDLYPLDLLSNVLTGGENSRLIRRLRDELKLVTGIGSSSYTPAYDGGYFAISATLDPANLDKAEKAILEEIRKVCQEPVADNEMRVAKRQKITEHIFGLQTDDDLASSVGIDILSAYDPNFSRNYTSRIQQTTAKEIQQVAEKYFTDNGLCVSIVRPPTAVAPVAEQAAAEAGEVHESKLPNGLTLLVKRNPRLPIVSIQAYFMGGLRAEPDGLHGISAFTARLLTRGTKTRTAKQISEEFDLMGGGITGGSGNNSTYLSAGCFSDQFDKAMDIFADVLLNPAFPENEIARMRPPMMAAAAARDEDWHAELVDAFRERWYAAHPYRYPAIGTPESLSKITRAEIEQFDRSVFNPKQGVIAIYGDIDPDKAAQTVQRLFGNWRDAAPAPEWPKAEQPPAESKTVNVTGKTPMGGVFIGYPGMVMSDFKDRVAFEVLDAVLSGVEMPGGWLHEKLRGDQLVYEVHAYSFIGLEPGYFGIYAGCEPDKVEQVRDIILQQVGRLFVEDVSESELTNARQICVTTNVLDRQTNGQEAMLTALDDLYGLGYDYAAKYNEAIMGVTAEDVRRVAQKYMTNYLCVLMKPAEAPKSESAPSQPEAAPAQNQ